MTNGVTLERSVSGGLREVLTDRKLIAGGRGTIDFDRGAEKTNPAFGAGLVDDLDSCPA